METGVIGVDNLKILNHNNIAHEIEIIPNDANFNIQISPERFNAEPDTNYLWINDF